MLNPWSFWERIFRNFKTINVSTNIVICDFSNEKCIKISYVYSTHYVVQYILFAINFAEANYKNC